MIARLEEGTTEKIERAVKEALQFVAEAYRDEQIDRIVADYSSKLRAKLVQLSAAMDVEVRRKMPSPDNMKLGVDVVFHIRDMETK